MLRAPLPPDPALGALSPDHPASMTRISPYVKETPVDVFLKTLLPPAARDINVDAILGGLRLGSDTGRSPNVGGMWTAFRSSTRRTNRIIENPTLKSFKRVVRQISEEAHEYKLLHRHPMEVLPDVAPSFLIQLCSASRVDRSGLLQASATPTELPTEPIPILFASERGMLGGRHDVRSG